MYKTLLLSAGILFLIGILTPLAFALYLGILLVVMIVCILLCKSAFRLLNKSKVTGVLTKCLVVILTISLCLFLFFILTVDISSGSWRCLVCDKLVYRTTYFGIGISTTKDDDLYYYNRGREGVAERIFEKWYWKNIGIEHTHDWTPIGCHFSLSTISCSFEGLANNFYMAIPYVSEKEIAISMARRVALSSPEERQKLLERFGYWGRLINIDTNSIAIQKDEKVLVEKIQRGEPWVSFYGGELQDSSTSKRNLTREEFLKYYKVWLKLCPEWQK